jgi:hypothetical protein
MAGNFPWGVPKRNRLSILGKSTLSCAEYKQRLKLYVFDSFFSSFAGVCGYKQFTRHCHLYWRRDHHGEPDCFSMGKSNRIDRNMDMRRITQGVARGKHKFKSILLGDMKKEVCLVPPEIM